MSALSLERFKSNLDNEPVYVFAKEGISHKFPKIPDVNRTKSRFEKETQIMKNARLMLLQNVCKGNVNIINEYSSKKLQCDFLNN